MVFSRVQTLGWAFGEILTSAQMNQLDINMTRALDGYAGGTYSPSAKLEINNEFEADATGSADTNATGLVGRGKGNEPGIKGVGGTTGDGGIFEGGSTDGDAGDFTAIASTSNAISARSGLNASSASQTVLGDATNGASNNATAVRGNGRGGPGLWGTSYTSYACRLGVNNPASPTKPIHLLQPFSAKPSGLTNPDDDGGIWARTSANLRVYFNGVTYNIMLDGGNTRAVAVRAWGKATTDGVGGVQLDNGYGCTVAIQGSIVRVTFITSMLNADYAVSGAAFSPSNDRFVSIDNMASTHVDLAVYDISAGLLNLASTAAVFTFQAFGDIAAY